MSKSSPTDMFRFPSMRHTFLFCTILLLSACARTETKLIWIEGERQPDKHAVHTLLVCNPPKGIDWDIWGVFDRTWTMPVKVLEGSDGVLSRYDGVCLRLTPTVWKDTLRIEYDNIYLNKHCRAPRGFSLRRRGGSAVALPLEYRFLPDPPAQKDSFVYVRPVLTDMIPQLKRVAYADSGRTAYQLPFVRKVEGKKTGWYRIILDGAVCIEAADETGEDYAQGTLERLWSQSEGNQLPNMTVEDWPDFPIRAFMLDVARNFMPKEQVFTLIDILHRAKMNTMLIHLTDDEGWRLEIGDLSELTSFGAFHDTPVRNEDGTYQLGDGLFLAQDGRIGRSKPWRSGSGYYTKEDYIDILRYAKARHIRVIPEVDMPGHCSAAIESMAYRARMTGDSAYVLTSPGDTSRYMAYQGFEHNVIDPALPSTYRFIGKVFDELIKIYKDAGVPLETINIAGDEVAEGCWMGSPACRKMMDERNWRGSEDLWEYFLDRVIDLLSERGLRFAAYAEVLSGTSERVLAKMRERSEFIIVWSALDEDVDAIPYRFANKGFKILLSHGDYTYMDNAYSKHRLEPGLTWAGPTSERKAWSYAPYSLYPDQRAIRYPLKNPENLIGVEPMLWGDNGYSFETACYLLFPKVYGLFERCWNARTPLTDEAFGQFYSIVKERELPYLDMLGLTYRSPQEGYHKE